MGIARYMDAKGYGSSASCGRRDSLEGIDGIEGLREFPHAKSSEEEKRVATVVGYTLPDTRASDVEDDTDRE